jgi:hypothetical protein
MIKIQYNSQTTYYALVDSNRFSLVFIGVALTGKGGETNDHGLSLLRPVGKILHCSSLPAKQQETVRCHFVWTRPLLPDQIGCDMLSFCTAVNCCNISSKVKNLPLFCFPRDKKRLVTQSVHSFSVENSVL